MALWHECYSAFNGVQKEGDRRSTRRDKRFPKTNKIDASLNVKETMQTHHCPLADGPRKYWNYHLFRNMNAIDRYADEGEAMLMLRILGQMSCNQRIKVDSCGMNGCCKKHKRLLHSQNQISGQSRSQRKRINQLSE